MSDSKTEAGRLAILSGIADIAKAAVTDQRALAGQVMEPGDAHALRHPVTGAKLARVRMSDPKPAAVVVDRKAVEEWIRANDPAKVQVRQQIAPGRDAEVLAVLAKHAPGLVDLVSSVPDYAVEEIVKLSTKAGQPIGPGGELDIPGIEMRTPTGSVSVGEKADDWLDQLRGLVMAGRVGIDGSVRELDGPTVVDGSTA